MESTPPESPDTTRPFSPTDFAYLCDLLLNHCCRRPVAATSTNRKQKIAQDLGAERCVGDFRMKLHTEDSTLSVFNRVKCVVSQGGDAETRWHGGHLIAMTHPDIHLGRQPIEQQTGCRRRPSALHSQIRDWATISLRHPCRKPDLQAVADPQHGAINRFEQLRVGTRRVRPDRRRQGCPKESALQAVDRNSFDRGIERKNFAIDTCFANAARDQLCVLRSKVKYYDGFVLRVAGSKKAPLVDASCVLRSEFRLANRGLYFRI